MNLEWDVIVTQIIGFLVVLWILRKYAWGHLMGFIEKRRELIASEFETIETSKVEVEELRQKFDKELADIEATRRTKIQDAAQDANKLASDIKEEARRESVALRVKTNQDIELELDKANIALRDRMVKAVIIATEKLIDERLDSDKHRKLINEFLDKVDVKA